MRVVLEAHGYIAKEFGAPGKAGGLRRILFLGNNNPEDGHAVVMEDDESIVDPGSNATKKKSLLDYANSRLRVKRVFVITKKED